MDIELCRALERGMKGPASIKQPLISIYDTLIITFDPLCNPAVIKNNFSSLLVFASNVKTLETQEAFRVQNYNRYYLKHTA